LIFVKDPFGSLLRHFRIMQALELVTNCSLCYPLRKFPQFFILDESHSVTRPLLLLARKY
jgi:hypothetical protein